MGGYGRGARMKIEADQIEWLAGVRAGEPLGSPVGMLVWNRDWEHWRDVMGPEPDAPGAERRRQVTRPRPGHADLAGSVKYDRQDARDILERASARETVARVACGAVCKLLLDQFGVEIGSHVVELGGVVADVGARHAVPLPVPLNAASDASPVRCLDAEAERRSEEHTSELQSRLHLVCRLLLEKKKNPMTALAKAPENTLGTHSSDLGTLEPYSADLIPG